MKKYLPLLICLLLLNAMKNEPLGFNGIPWNTKLDRAKYGLKHHSFDKIYGYYTRPADKLMVGKIPVEKIIYIYYRERFQGVYIVFCCQYISHAVRELKRLHGKPYQPDRLVDNYWWYGKKKTRVRLFVDDYKACAGKLMFGVIR